MIDFTVFTVVSENISKKVITCLKRYNGYLLFLSILAFFVFFSLFLDHTLGAINKSTGDIDFPSEGYTVYMKDRLIGTVYNRWNFFNLLETLEKEYPWTADEKLLREIVRFEKTTLENPAQPTATLIKNIKGHLDGITKGWSVVINHEELVVVDSKREAEQVLQTIIDHNTPEKQEDETIESLEVNFLDDVDIQPKIAKKDVLVAPKDAVRYIEKGTFEEKTYEVAPSDTIWDISRRYNISLDDIQKANPDLNMDRIYPGDEINLIVPKPFVTVGTRFVHTYPQIIPYRTRVIWDAAVYRNKTIQERRGIYGKEVITASVNLKNGVETEKTILDRKILSNPQTRVLRRGTKRTPEDVLLAGAILTPDTGIISSFYGPRWGGFHYGVDIAVPIGTPVHAYKTGTVEFVGRYGSMGNMVIIDHDGEYITKYGHLSRIIVNTGDRVMKRQYIADSGNSGYSTGPHVHFEVRIKGKVIDPLVFLSNRE